MEQRFTACMLLMTATNAFSYGKDATVFDVAPHGAGIPLFCHFSSLVHSLLHLLLFLVFPFFFFSFVLPIFFFRPSLPILSE